jgi:trigger factor
MQVSVENMGGLERRVTVQIPADEIQQKVDSRLRELCKQAKIKGFRPGRVPMSVVRQRYGKGVRLEVTNEAMQTSLQQAIRDEKLRPVSAPQVTDMPQDLGTGTGDVEFTAVLEVYPDLEKLDLSGLPVEKPEAAVAADDIDDMLQTLRQQRRSWNPVERTPQDGDQVVFEYSAQIDGERIPAEGGQRLSVVTGASGFDSLESALSGLKAGEECSVELEFPKHFREPKLAGQKAQVELKVITVSESELPEIDEDFIRGFGIEDGNVESLRSEVKENLERELRQAVTSILKVRIINALVESMPDLEVPNSIVRQEAASLASRAASQEGREATPEEAPAFMEQATRRVRGGLLMGEIARQNAIRIDGAQVRRAIETIAQTYENPTEVIQLYYGNQQLLSQIENQVLEEQVVDWVMGNAKVSSMEMKFQDVISTAAGANR